MNRLITSDEAVRLAFPEGELVEAARISEPDIAAAEELYLVPVIGRRLHARLLAGAYAPLREEYVAPATAVWVRILVQPAFDIRTAQYGTTAPKSSYYEPAGAEPLRRRDKALRIRGRSLLRRLTAYLDAHRAEYPEYDPEENILKRCRIDGDLVQIL